MLRVHTLINKVERNVSCALSVVRRDNSEIDERNCWKFSGRRVEGSDCLWYAPNISYIPFILRIGKKRNKCARECVTRGNVLYCSCTLHRVWFIFILVICHLTKCYSLCFKLRGRYRGNWAQNVQFYTKFSLLHHLPFYSSAVLFSQLNKRNIAWVGMEVGIASNFDG